MCHCVESGTSLQVLNSIYVLNSLERQVRHEITNANPEFWQPLCVSKQAKKLPLNLWVEKKIQPPPKHLSLEMSGQLEITFPFWDYLITILRQ